nr:uncharacterized protein CTRU02_00509 [Colletotrichum truncatum]KAF6801760.1 hypothetical protein CTRU02_00509 [Colletotrichum truncatum]
MPGRRRLKARPLAIQFFVLYSRMIFLLLDCHLMDRGLRTFSDSGQPRDLNCFCRQ